MATKAYYGSDPQMSPDYGRVINRKAFDRLQKLLESGKPIIGARRTQTIFTSRRPFLSMSHGTPQFCKKRSSDRFFPSSKLIRSRRS